MTVRWPCKNSPTTLSAAPREIVKRAVAPVQRDLRRGLVVLAVMILSTSAALAHGGEEHEPARSQPDETVQASAGLPNCHPLIVHLPIVALPLAGLFVLAALLRSNREFAQAGLALGLLGLAGAALAVYALHPHTHGLSAVVAEELEEHELFADLTVYAAVAANLSMVLEIVFKKTRLLFGLAFVLFVATSSFVFLAGHHGARLTHVHGVGVGGQFLEPER